MFDHPWLVVDTWGECGPIGCWTEAAAKRLPSDIQSRVEMGRWIAMPRSEYTPPARERVTEGKLRDLAVEIVDSVLGYTLEFSNSPNSHEHDYDWVQEKLTELVGSVS